MTKKQMLAECRRLAPDFTMKFETADRRERVVATCTKDGAPLVLAMAVDGWPRAKIETRILEGALESLRWSRVGVATRKR